MNRLSWSDERVAQLRSMWEADEDVASIASTLRTSRGAIYVKASAIGLTRRRRKGRGTVPAITTATRDITGQRRFIGHEHDGSGSRVVLPPYHPAARDGATIFPSTVRPAAMLPQLLKSGQNSRKLGSMIEKGEWRGFPIFMLTLEERHTCPRSCIEWANCYGNNMHMAQRIADDGTLTRRLWGELASLSARHPTGFLVRLHILGDFYSVEYVRFWRQALADFPPLRVFGFTARQPVDPIGAEILRLIVDERVRFRIRVSGGGYETDCAEVVDRSEQAVGILCPAQQDADRCCATCALCWSTDRTITFLRH